MPPVKTPAENSAGISFFPINLGMFEKPFLLSAGPLL